MRRQLVAAQQLLTQQLQVISLQGSGNVSDQASC